MGAMRDLHGRRACIAVDRDHLAAKALQLDCDLLAELARTAEQNPRRARRSRRTDLGHGSVLRSVEERAGGAHPIVGRRDHGAAGFVVERAPVSDLVGGTKTAHTSAH